MSATPHPLSDESLNALFSPFLNATGVVVAVSGGPDSIALMHLLAHWNSPSRPPVFVATVDHGLRPESAKEAAFVVREAELLGFPGAVLEWRGKKPETGVQEAAREARYELLANHARRVGASHIATAHTLDDQAETVLMRMARGSGLAGLAGMRAARDLDGLHLVRPLLDIGKADLVVRCQKEGWAFIIDPSNANERFARVRWRKVLPDLAKEGLTAERLARLAARAGRAEEALDTKAREAFLRGWSQEERAFAAAVLGEEPFEIALRVLMLLLSKAGLEPDFHRLERLEACLERLRGAIAEGRALRLTVAGAVLALDRRGRLTIAPEPPRRRGRPDKG
ncbi:tRNA lysidine(34) synthetase TilS [Microvirga flavescens]|uniref:tRNA lysidine(34) synthetase TilS n=1 Tax=Microvirga flavescens TaxID=2249811 RepID=UPI000DDBCB71|nr:tRNA lysidine(34) synthetase TilS [Microvirga flavescens]